MARPKRITYAATVLILAGIGIAAFGASFALEATNDALATRIGPLFFWVWAVFFLAVGTVHVVAGAGAARGRRWGMWLAATITVGGAILGAVTLVEALSNVTRYMDVGGTIGLAVVVVLYALAAWSLWSARQWYEENKVAV
jgi:hypothetical protein